MLYMIGVIAGYLFYATAILTQILVIKKKISYKFVNGGRSESYEAQLKTSYASIMILSVLLIVFMIFNIFSTLSHTLFGVILMGLVSLYWFMGLVMQLLGTSFERKYLSGVLIVGLFAHVVVFIQYFIN